MRTVGILVMGRRVSDQIGSAIAPDASGDFNAIDVGDKSIVVKHLEIEFRKKRRVPEDELGSDVYRGKIGSGELVEFGRVVVIATAKSCRARWPARVIESRLCPVYRRLLEAEEIAKRCIRAQPKGFFANRNLCREELL